MAWHALSYRDFREKGNTCCRSDAESNAAIRQRCGEMLYARNENYGKTQNKKNNNEVSTQSQKGEWTLSKTQKIADVPHFEKRLPSFDVEKKGNAASVSLTVPNAIAQRF